MQVMELDPAMLTSLMQSVEEGKCGSNSGSFSTFELLDSRESVRVSDCTHHLGMLPAAGLLSFETGVQMQSCAVVEPQAASFRNELAIDSIDGTSNRALLQCCLHGACLPTV